MYMYKLHFLSALEVVQSSLLIALTDRHTHTTNDTVTYWDPCRSLNIDLTLLLTFQEAQKRATDDNAGTEVL